ncbi:MAG: hypothetical protein M3N93_11515 [Acidobacteriota bacterium]|nr:hypothetical protein [Acidobacteriota bacterium]
MGLVLRDDPPRVIDMKGRVWGEPVEGLMLSIRELPRDNEHGVAGISVVMKNESPRAKTLRVRPLVFFYRIEGLDLAPYGRQFMSSQAGNETAEVNLPAKGAIETDLPLGAIYNLRSAGTYTVRVSCGLPGGELLRSNDLAIRV